MYKLEWNISFKILYTSFLFLVSLGASYSSPFYVAGRIENPVRNFGYEAWVNGKEWQIKIHYSDESHYRLLGSDGVNVYSYLFILERIDERKMLSGNIGPGLHPLNHNMYAYLPWFAFCSEFFFQVREEEPIPPPWSAPRHRIDSGITEAEVTLFSSGVKVPRSADFYVTEESRKRLQQIDWINEDAKEAELLANEYFDGFLAGTYRVGETVELNGIEIPSKIDVVRYLPVKPGSTGTQEQWKMTVTVEDFRSETLESYLPVIPEGFSVSLYDSRLRDMSADIRYTSYLLENGVWPLSPPKEAVDRFESNRVLFAESRGAPFSQPKILVIFFVVLVGGPALALFLIQKRKHGG